MELTDLPTMQQRVGNRYRWSIESGSLWTRIESAYSHIKPAAEIDGATYDASSWKAQAGLDGLLHESTSGNRLVGGIVFNYNQGAATTIALPGSGAIKSKGYGFGGTLTWLEKNGFYVDGQASVIWFDSTLLSYSGAAQPPTITETPGFGYALSVESGRKIGLGAEWAVIPQAQLTFSSVGFYFADGQSGGDQRLYTRFGISLADDQNWLNKAGIIIGRSHVYALANLYYEIFNSTEFGRDDGELEGGIGVGASFNWDHDKYGVYGEISARTGLATFSDNYTITGTVGLHVRF